MLSLAGLTLVDALSASSPWSTEWVLVQFKFSIYRRAKARATHMSTDANSPLPKYLRTVLLSGVLLAVALVIIGRFIVPTTAIRSTVAALVALIAYGVVAAFCPTLIHRRHPDVLRMAILFGLLAGAVFNAEIILEYIFLPSSNSRYGMVEFGTVLTLYFTSAFISALRSASLGKAILTSVASAFIASLVWVNVVLIVFYAFRGSPRQEIVLRAEGDYDDFARSGMTDFNAFIMEDFMGAAFFHLLLGLAVAALLGLFGGLLGKIIARFRNRQAGT